MKFTVLTLFPELMRSYFLTSIMGRAVDRGLVSYDLINIRDFATDRHRTCDDAPYGGGAGMVLKAEPLAAALDSVDAGERTVVYPSPAGRAFDHGTAARLAKHDELVFICGHYEGIDQRIVDLYVHEELTIGDYVISSGEIATMVIVDAVFRLLDGVLSTESLEQESHSHGLLEYPHYTRPESFRGLTVPEVLLSGHHARIEEWRRAESLKRTRERRPDLWMRGGGNDGSDQITGS